MCKKIFKIYQKILKVFLVFMQKNTDNYQAIYTNTRWR